MGERQYQKIFLFLIAWLGLVFFASPLATAKGLTIYLPACGSDPNANTRALQQAIDNAPDGSTLVLASGVCVITKCENAEEESCDIPESGLRRNSALKISKSSLTLVGAPDTSSVLKLDPNPPPRSDHYHAYCGDTHVLLIIRATFITLQDFAVDGSDGELPEDSNQCPGGNTANPNQGKITEHMYDVYIENSTDITINRMNILKAHGDGINLIADLNQASITRTERISITNTRFLDNDRSGVGFQRNVGYVTIRGNYFKNSGDDQDLDMEASGLMNFDNVGPYEVEIDNNLFERTKPKLTVTLGSSGILRAREIRFTNNIIRPVSTLPTNQGGGCIRILGADNTTIENNTVIGALSCITLEASTVSNLRIKNNRFEGYTNTKNASASFAPKPVIHISEDLVNRGDETCGAPPKKLLCPYFIHYPDRITIIRNTILQHVQYSPGIELDNADPVAIINNDISNTRAVPPIGTFDSTDPTFRPIGIHLVLGVQIPHTGYPLNEKTLFQSWSIMGNQLTEFADSIEIVRRKAAMRLSRATVTSNEFNTSQNTPRGIWLKGAENSFISGLTVSNNRFGCGFNTNSPNPTLPPNAFVRPSDQVYTGNIGSTTPCH